MKKKEIKAYAKINLGLKVLRKREDGYHDIETTIVPITLCDEITIEKTGDNKISLSCNVKELETEKNLCWRAAESLNVKGIKITLTKNVPMESGLGGGSADCGATLIALNELFNLQKSKQELADIGRTLGADVPACMAGVPVFVEGMGERLTEIANPPDLKLVLVKPEISLSTGVMYRKIDELRERAGTDIFKNALNDFELVAEDPIIEEIKRELTELGAKFAQMTGSGSCVYGIFENEEQQLKAYEELKNKREVYICTNLKQ